MRRTLAAAPDTAGPVDHFLSFDLKTDLFFPMNAIVDLKDLTLTELEDLVADKLGCKVHAPFMHLSFLALSTSPKWKITDMGIVDVENFEILDPVVK